MAFQFLSSIGLEDVTAFLEGGQLLQKWLVHFPISLFPFQGS